MTNRFGCVYSFVSDQVLENDPKPKYHIALCVDDGAFLFINSEPFEDSFRIDKADWPDMPKDESYISCNKVIRYQKEYFKEMNVELCGRINDDCLRRLREHLPNCDSLVTPELNYATQEIDKNVN